MRPIRIAAILATALFATPAPAVSPAQTEEFLLTTEAWELVPLAGEVRSIAADPILARIELRARRPDVLEAELRKNPPHLCPRVEREGEKVVLRCDTRRLDAELVEKNRQLAVRKLRGTPWRGPRDRSVLRAWDPEEVGIGGPCPGDNPLAQGECHLARGDLAAADRAFQAEKAETALAAVRRGDIALAQDRPVDAVRLWRAAGKDGPWGRVAQSRLCELLGDCLGTLDAARLFATVGLPPPVAAEQALRAARLEAYAGDPRAAVTYLLGQASVMEFEELCPKGELACARITQGALALPGTRDHANALSVYFLLSDRFDTQLAAPLAREAARVAAEQGAPVFAGNILAATTGTTDPDDLEDHLHLAAELYLRGDDLARAQVILDYVRFRFGPARLESARWKPLHDRVLGRGPGGPTSATKLAKEVMRDAELARELAEAALAAARARSLEAAVP